MCEPLMEPTTANDTYRSWVLMEAQLVAQAEQLSSPCFAYSEYWRLLSGSTYGQGSTTSVEVLGLWAARNVVRRLSRL